MAKFRYKQIDGGKVNVSKVEHHHLYGVSWRFGTSTNVNNDKESIRKAERYISDYIEKRKEWPLSKLVDTYPSQYSRALNRTSGEKASLTYKQAVEELVIWMRGKNVSQNTIHGRIKFLRHMGDLYDLHKRDVTLISAQEVNRLLLDKHKSLNTHSTATFDTGLASFRWLFRYLYEKEYTDTNLLKNHDFIKPDLNTEIVRKSRKDEFFDEYELTFIYDCLDDRRHRLKESDIKELRSQLLKDKRKGIPTDDHQFYKAHYKVRQILQLMIDTGLRSGEVIALRYKSLEGCVLLKDKIDFSSRLWLTLEKFYATLTDDSVYSHVLEKARIDDISLSSLEKFYPRASKMSFEQRTSFINTLKFIDRFESDDLVYWRDFGFKQWWGGGINPTRRNKRSVNFEDLVLLENDIFWLADAVPGMYAYFTVEGTVSKGLDDKGQSYIFIKDTAKTTASTGRGIPLEKRARDTLSKVWRDIIKLEEPDTSKVDFMFLNSEGGHYDPSAITNAWTKLNRKMRKIRPDLPILSPHKLRHSYLTYKANNSKTMGDLVKLSNIAGHAKMSTTLDVYVHHDAGQINTDTIHHF
ncbi:tyrosine-type recombinase/integrase [Aerococcaceae bacterium WS4759]|uniref:Tyrosine-type recombinase/integrase n=1 Tax=Fundicoccus ignavus TaxID=2664442 RepID=A0A6I2GNL5_9LACT|nr:tyrosine-type recombinase/integrase [Fundicoccus ignavus]MRI86068.1 tyrosine-type recombinase/integrase [Fundicoccus ignavus]